MTDYVMFVDFTVYDSSGTILRTGACPADMLQLQAGPGENAIIGKSYIQSDRVIDGDTPIISSKPQQAITVTGLTFVANNTAFATFSGIASGSSVKITPEVISDAAASSTLVNDGTARIFSSIKGKFGIVIDHPDYQSYTNQIEAT